MFFQNSSPRLVLHVEEEENGEKKTYNLKRGQPNNATPRAEEEENFFVKWQPNDGPRGKNGGESIFEGVSQWQRPKETQRKVEEASSHRKYRGRSTATAVQAPEEKADTDQM